MQYCTTYDERGAMRGVWNNNIIILLRYGTCNRIGIGRGKSSEEENAGTPKWRG